MINIDSAVREVLAELGAPAKAGAAAPGPAGIARGLEHSLLVPGLAREKLLAECRVARGILAAAVCVAPYYVPDAAGALAGSGVAVCAAVGFPGAFMSTEAKIADVRASCMCGAAEIDLAINIAAVKSGDMPLAERDFNRAAEAAGGRAAVKAVFEHGSYDEREREAVLLMIGRSGVPYVKIQNMTSGHGARPEEIRLVRGVLGETINIKIDGGVKTLAQALELFRAGAARIGLTATEAVAKEAKAFAGKAGGNEIERS